MSADVIPYFTLVSTAFYLGRIWELNRLSRNAALGKEQ